MPISSTYFRADPNEARPLCAEFRFRQAGVPVADPFGWVLLIDRNGILVQARDRVQGETGEKGGILLFRGAKTRM